MSDLHYETYHAIEDQRPQLAHPDVALAVYRVVQEWLRNVAKHSRASEAPVSLSKTKDGIHLSISADGVGFDEEETRFRKGLGIVSMEERIRLLKRDFSLESHSGGGTRVKVRISVGGSTS
jgi:signal transduction histidine kinase